MITITGIREAWLRLVAKIFKTKKTAADDASGYVVEKYLYGVIFEKGTGKILLIKSGGMYWLPGGEVFPKDVFGFGEGWKRRFFSIVVPEETGIAAYFVEDSVQDMSANYEVYPPGKNEEHTAIIIGEVYPYQVIKPEAKFYSLEEIENFIKEGRMDDDEALLIARSFVSRDCCNKEYRKKAIPLLKELLNQRSHF
ncbi:MAG: hypothetical protein WC420_03640 [Candidatus Paceibacterota bacterium]|jgi:hypothetical protein